MFVRHDYPKTKGFVSATCRSFRHSPLRAMADDADEWRVVRVRRPGKGKPQVGGVTRRDAVHAKRINANAFEALVGDDEVEDRDDKPIVNTAPPPSTGKDKGKDKGGGKKQSKPQQKGDTKRDQANPPVALDPTTSPLTPTTSFDENAIEVMPSKTFSIQFVLIAIAKARRAFLNAITLGMLLRGVSADARLGSEGTMEVGQNAVTPSESEALEKELTGAVVAEKSETKKTENQNEDVPKPSGHAPRVNTSWAESSDPETPSLDNSERRVNMESSQSSPGPASAPPMVEASRDATTRRVRVAANDQKGHSELVRAVAVNAHGDGAMVVTGGWDGCVRRFRWQCGDEDSDDVLIAGAPLLAHADRVEFVDMAGIGTGGGGSDGDKPLVVTGGRDCSLRVYDVSKQSPQPLKKVYTYESISSGSVDWGDRGSNNSSTAAVGTKGGALLFWDLETGSQKRTINDAHGGETTFVICPSTSGVNNLTNSPLSGIQFISGGADGVVKGWDTRVNCSGKCAFEFGGHARRVYSATTDGDSKIFVGDFSGRVKVHDLRYAKTNSSIEGDTSSGSGALPIHISIVPSYEFGGAPAPIAGVHYANLSGTSGSAALCATAAFFDETSDDPKGCVRVLSLTDYSYSDEAKNTETCTLTNDGGLLSAFASSVGGDVLAAGDVDGGVTVWRRGHGKFVGGESNSLSNDSSTRFPEDAEGGGRWDPTTVVSARLGFAEDDE